MEEIRERFRNLKLEVLEDIVRNQKDDYTEEAYSIAVEELKVKTSNEYVDSLLNKLQNEPKKENKKNYGIIVKIIFFILLGAFICINFRGLFWFAECYVNSFRPFVLLEAIEGGPSLEYDKQGNITAIYDTWSRSAITFNTKASLIFPIFIVTTLLLLIILRKKSRFLRCMLIIGSMLLELFLFTYIYVIL